jgi:GT2 family glycosyltransferase
MTFPKVSVICIAKHEGELAEKERQLSTQTYRDYEFVGAAGGTIPQAWNRSLDRAQGEILVFTETDVTPVNERWLEELVAAVHNERTIVKGPEVNSLPLDMSSLACHRSVFATVRFDEDFLWAEDSELFCKLKRQGCEFQHVVVTPVLHLNRLASKRYIRRAFRYGIYNARLRLRYADPVLVAGLEDAWKRLLTATLNILGLAVGYLVYWPEHLSRRKSPRGSEKLGG